MGYGSYVVAGCDTYQNLVQKFLDKYNDLNYFDSNKVKNFQKETINRFLISFGTGLNYKTKKISKNHAKSFIDMVSIIKNCNFMNESYLYWDSGGYQIACGALTTIEIPKFLDLYYNTIANNSDKFSYSFILDVPPGPGSKDLFNSYNQIEQLNRTSYQMCKNIVPIDIRKKISYIHHFRTPALFKTWNKFLFDEDLADGYEEFSTGGIVANISSDILIPIIIYTIPLSSIVLYAKQKKMTRFNFHVLGGANFLDVFYHKLFSKHIKEYHNIDTNITYDSSALFKGLNIGRFIYVLNDKGNLVKMDLRSLNLPMKFFNECTVEEKTYQILNNLATEFGFKQLDKINVPIYDSKTNTFSKPILMYLFFYVLSIYRKMEKKCEQVVDDIYPLYKNNKIFEFDKECSRITTEINQGRITRKQRAKCYSLVNSLKILENLDMKGNENLVEKFMISGDISNIGSNGIPRW